MKYIVLALILAALILLYIRLAPADIDRWHVSPAAAKDPGYAGTRLIGTDAPRFDAPAAAVLKAVKAAASGRDRVSILAEDDMRLTFETRSKWIGFPDYVTFEAHPDDGTTRLDILSRSRFGGYDWGLNSARIKHWERATRDALRQD